MRNNTIISKALLLLVALTCSLFAKAQDPCEITCNVEMPVCSESAVTLSVPNNYQYSFNWSPGGQTTNRITVHPIRTTTYRVQVRDTETDTLVCENDFRVEVLPRFEMKFRQLKLTCSNHEEENGRTAQVVAAVDSLGTIYNPPYTYQWQVSPLHIAPGDPTWAIGLEAYKYYYIKVTDGRGCTQRDSVSLRAYPNPLVEISTDPGDTVYLQNPHEIYSFENLSEDTLDISNFYWILNQQYNITSTENEPRFTYVEVGDYTTELKVYNPQGCDTSYYKSIRVEPVKLKIPNVFTPNGDGTNDYFIISLESGSDSPSGNKGTHDQHYEYEDYEPLNRYYESTELTIFNRWGRIVYHSKDYQNDWDGDNLPDGTYFYVLKCHGLKNDATYNGSVMIVKARRGE
jgi:PKD repeat protein